MNAICQRLTSTLAIALAVIAIMAGGCVSAQTLAKKDGKSFTPGKSKGWQTGKTIEGAASWYGKKFHGKLTANGETYDMHGMSAAHRTMPLGSEVRVTNLANGKKTVVRVNDRGPYAKNRVLDLSYAAACKLGYTDQGTTKVRIEVLKVGDNRYRSGNKMALPEEGSAPTATGSEEASEQGRLLQVGIYDSRMKAERLYYYLRGRFTSCHIVKSGKQHRIMIGPFGKESIRRKTYKRLKMEGYDVKFE